MATIFDVATDWLENAKHILDKSIETEKEFNEFRNEELRWPR